MLRLPSRRKSGYQAVRGQLLRPPWATRELNLREVLYVARKLNRNALVLRLFGMNPLQWYAAGIRVMGRTAVEATRDQHARFLAKAIAETLRGAGHSLNSIVDPFVGSGNLLYHVVRETGARRAVGLDSDPGLLGLTKRNFAILQSLGKLEGVDIELHAKDWTEILSFLSDPGSLVIIHPPWGGGYTEQGLDLENTDPSVPRVLKTLQEEGRAAPLFAVIQLYPRMVGPSLSRIAKTYDLLDAAKPAGNVAKYFDYRLLRIRG